MANCVTIVGIQWGDEGKGKVTDLLACSADLVVRYQGGANAGHTIVADGRKFILHQIPSGIFNPRVQCVIGPFVVVDPETLITELNELRLASVIVQPDRLIISSAAHAVMPYHKALDRVREQALGSGKIGTTGRGIGPAYEDLVARHGIRMSDLLDRDRLSKRLELVLRERNALLSHYGEKPLSLEEVLSSCLAWGNVIKPYLKDAGAVISTALEKGSKVLFESAQGTLLDVLHGTYPFVTSSLTTAPAAFPLTGVGIPKEAVVVGVMKAYTTRVGGGPFPTEQNDALGQYLREKGGEYGSTTGRPRRCGWLDLPLLRYAVRVNGVNVLAVMKLDVLSGLDRIPVCTAYQSKLGELREVHPEQLLDATMKPVFEFLPGWNNVLEHVSDISGLPEEARFYIKYVEDALMCPVGIVSVGPERHQTILYKDPWSV